MNIQYPQDNEVMPESFFLLFEINHLWCVTLCLLGKKKFRLQTRKVFDTFQSFRYFFKFSILFFLCFINMKESDATYKYNMNFLMAKRLSKFLKLLLSTMKNLYFYSWLANKKIRKYYIPRQYQQVLILNYIRRSDQLNGQKIST